jgi:uncharacterized protein YbjT (DUF2867 family)
MKVIFFGATGMVGRSVLQECLLAAEVEEVLLISRSSIGREHPKLNEIIRDNVADLEDLQGRIQGFDACFFCLGVSSAGIFESDYRRVTFDLTLSVARTLSKLAPRMTFIYASGLGTDATEKGSVMWARIKGETENALQRLPFKAAYMFRIGLLQPGEGISGKNPALRILYAVLRPLIPALRRTFPNLATTSQQLGRAMIAAGTDGAPKTVLEVADINQLAGMARGVNVK